MFHDVEVMWTWTSILGMGFFLVLVLDRDGPASMDLIGLFGLAVCVVLFMMQLGNGLRFS